MNKIAPTTEQRTVAARSGADQGDVSQPLDSLSVGADIVAVAAGDRARFASMFRRWAPRAKTYLIDRGLPPSLAEELATQAMVEIWRQAKSFDASGDCGHAWIFRRLSEVLQATGLGPRLARVDNPAPARADSSERMAASQ